MRKPTVIFKMPYTTKLLSKAQATPNAVPNNCAVRLTPPRPPSDWAPKIPAAMPPQVPHKPCKGHTPSTSSMRHLFWVKVNITTKMPPATAPTTSAPMGCIKSEPAHTATKPAKGPLCTKPGSFLPSSKATKVPPTMAIKELTATKPEILSSVCALMTLKPNQPTIKIQAPKARKGMLEGGCAEIAPSLRYRLLRAPVCNKVLLPTQP